MNTIVLDDGIEYAIVREDVINGTEYTLFTNVNDNSKICFRKTVIEDGEEYYIGLDSDKEFDFTKPFEGNVSIYTKLTKIVNESQTKEEEKNPKTSDMNLALILTSLGLASVGAVLVSRKKLAKANR